jgi:UDP-N-acetylglucosamine enolpyruvyl transferase
MVLEKVGDKAEVRERRSSSLSRTNAWRRPLPAAAAVAVPAVRAPTALAAALAHRAASFRLVLPGGWIALGVRARPLPARTWRRR